MSFQAFLFDLDGTLVDSAAAICDAAAEALRALGCEASAQDILPHLGAPLDELYAEFIGDGDDDARARFTQLYIDFHDAHPERHPPPLPGVEVGIAALLGRAPLAVATTKPTDRATEQLEQNLLLPSFRHVQGTDLGMQAKPHPDVILRACAALSVDPRRTVMVGDTLRDVMAAKAAGALAVAIAYDEEAELRARRFEADLVIRSVEELEGI